MNIRITDTTFGCEFIVASLKHILGSLGILAGADASQCKFAIFAKCRIFYFRSGAMILMHKSQSLILNFKSNMFKPQGIITVSSYAFGNV